MAIIRTLFNSLGGGLSDQWLEVIRPIDMGRDVLMTKGAKFRTDEKRSSNTRASDQTISNGSIIHVPENTCMLLIDGGAIVDYTAEAGYFEVKNSALPSALNGELKKSVKESFRRFKYGGTTPLHQEVVYINLQEIRDILFGTSLPLMYHDNDYDLDLEVRTHGSYSVEVVDPILFYKEVGDKTGGGFEKDDFNEQFKAEFMEALQVAISNLSIDGVKISHLPSHGSKLSSHMQEVLDQKWTELRGLEIVSVGIKSISYTEDSKEIIKMRNQGAVLRDANIRQGYVQGAMARGFESAGSNEGGSGNAFMGMGIGMNATGNMFGQMSQANEAQMQREAQKKAQEESSMAGSWTCPECGQTNNGKFCSNCGNKKPDQAAAGFCSNCGFKFEGEKPNFCPNCGNKN